MKDQTRIMVDLRSNTEVDAYYRGVYDGPQIEVIKKFININDVFLDIGANIGFYTIAIGAFIKSKKGSGKVHAFEPYSVNYNRLIKNIALNNLEGYCIATEIGLSDTSSDSEVVLRDDFLSGSPTGNTSIPINDQFDKGLTRAPIKLETLDSLYKSETQKIGFIKIDIEGHEDFFLRGAALTLNKHRPIILMEINKPFYIARCVQLDTVLISALPENYHIYKQSGQQLIKLDSFSACNTIDNVLLIPQ